MNFNSKKTNIKVRAAHYKKQNSFKMEEIKQEPDAEITDPVDSTEVYQDAKEAGIEAYYPIEPTILLKESTTEVIVPDQAVETKKCHEEEVLPAEFVFVKCEIQDNLEEEDDEGEDTEMMSEQKDVKYEDADKHYLYPNPSTSAQPKSSLEEEARLQKMFKCSYCEKSFKRKYNLNVHEVIHKGQECAQEYSCNECKKNFTSKSILRRHIQNIHVDVSQGEFKCEVCHKGFKNKKYLRGHQYTVHDKARTASYCCSVCGEWFEKKSNLDQHMLHKHSDKETVKGQCPKCDKLFKDKFSLRKHLIIHEPVKPFQCSVCGKGFTQKHHLTYHENTHTGDKPFVCHHEECGKRFGFKRALHLHQRTHQEVRQFHCLDCGKAYTKRALLINHMQMHNPEVIKAKQQRKHTCEKCKQTFNREDSLLSHMEVHSKKKKTDCRPNDKYKCTECERAFAFYGSLVIHMRVHSGLKPFV